MESKSGRCITGVFKSGRHILGRDVSDIRRKKEHCLVVNNVENKDNFIIDVAVAGINKENVEIKLDNNTLT